jgi:hypothetical protein
VAVGAGNCGVSPDVASRLGLAGCGLLPDGWMDARVLMPQAIRTHHTPYIPLFLFSVPIITTAAVAATLLQR